MIDAGANINRIADIGRVADGETIRLAVVGHTNTGKTSLMRTLLRDERFGEVANAPGTTRHVESARLLDSTGRAVLVLRDTPGLEDAMGALDYLDQLIKDGERLDGPQRIERLRASPESRHRFEQECRVLATVSAADAALYVVDARDPILAKHQDELTLLAYCGRPVLPVLNFTHDPQADTEGWRTALARLGLHVCVEFDTVAPALDGEQRLLERLALLLDAHADALQRLRDDLQAQRAQRRLDAARLIAELLMDAATLRLACARDPESTAQATRELRSRVRRREQDCVNSLLARYQFSPTVFPQHRLPLEGERWGMDLFNPEALKRFGIQVGKGLATGAAAGATLDVFTGGLSLGAATLLGAAIGGLWQGSEQWGRRLASRLSGHRELSVDQPVLQLLGLRQLALVQALEGRGHAALTPIDSAPLTDEQPPASPPSTSSPNMPMPSTNQPPPNTRMSASAAGPSRDLDDASSAGHASTRQASPTTLPESVGKILDDARGRPTWSMIGDSFQPDPDRDRLVQQMAQALVQRL